MKKTLPNNNADSPLKRHLQAGKKSFRVFRKPDFFEESGFSEKSVFQINGELV